MRLHMYLLAFLLLSANRSVAVENFTLPPEVTPALRAACEADVRRLCIHSESTVRTVRRCVLSQFKQLGEACQREIRAAGLAP